MNMKNILVPVDFSKNAFKAVEYGYYLAEQNKSDLHLLHIINSLKLEIGIPPEDRPVFEGIFFNSANEEMNSLVDKFPQSKIKIKKNILKGIPTVEILNYAISKSISLILLSSTGKGCHPNSIGKIASEILNKSTVPVFLVKTDNIFLDNILKNP